MAYQIGDEILVKATVDQVDTDDSDMPVRAKFRARAGHDGGIWIGAAEIVSDTPAEVSESDATEAINVASDHVADAALLSVSLMPDGVDADRFIVSVATTALYKIISDLSAEERARAVAMATILLRTIQ